MEIRKLRILMNKIRKMWSLLCKKHCKKYKEKTISLWIFFVFFVCICVWPLYVRILQSFRLAYETETNSPVLGRIGPWALPFKFATISQKFGYHTIDYRYVNPPVWQDDWKKSHNFEKSNQKIAKPKNPKICIYIKAHFKLKHISTSKA